MITLLLIIVDNGWQSGNSCRTIATGIVQQYDVAQILLLFDAFQNLTCADTLLPVERVNRFFGYAAVARLNLKQGKIAERPARTAPPSLRPAVAPPAELGPGLRAIADPELQAVLAALAAGVAGNRDIPVIGRKNDK